MDARVAELDREVERAARAWREAMRELRRRGPEALDDGAEPGGPANPLTRFRRVSSKATYLELTGKKEERIGAELGLHAGAVVPILGAGGSEPLTLGALGGAMRAPDPVSLAIAAWVEQLTLERVLFEDRARVAEAWHARSGSVDAGAVRAVSRPGAQPGPAATPRPTGVTQVSPREALLGMLAAPTESARQAFAEALARGAGAVAEAARWEAARRVEARRQLGADEGAAPREIPCDPPEALLRAAGEILERTAPLVVRAGTWDAAIARALGREAGEGWPARLTRRWIEELFRPSGLAEGLSLDLGPLPPALGASSFARALGRFGSALAAASAPRAAPFALVHPPLDLRRARRAALFAGLVADPVFHMRALGLGRGRARDQARSAGRALLLTLRLDAARLRLAHGARVGLAPHPLLLPPREGAERFEEETDRAIGAPIPGALAGVVPDLGPGASAHLIGALLAASDRRALVERHDEDWFRSPHAVEMIRGEEDVFPAAPGLLAPALPRPRAQAADIEAGLEELLRTLREIE